MESLPSCHAELAAHPAAGLRGDAEGLSVVIGNHHRLDGIALPHREKVFLRAVGRLGDALRGAQRRREPFGEPLAVRGGDTLVTLDDSLNQLASVAAGQAKSVSSTATAVYLLTASGVESYGYDGTHNWSRDYGAAPQAVINARETLVFISGTVEVLNAPHE